MSEFAVALGSMFFLFTFPLINLLGLATGFGTAAILANQAATRAASAQTYDSALSGVLGETRALLSSGFAAFARLVPVGGYKGTGVDLFVDATRYRGGATSTYGPNTPVPATPDPSTTFYELRAKITCQVGPVVSMEAIPYLRNIPGLSKPVTITYSASRASETPLGLNNSGPVAAGRSNEPLGVVNIPWDTADVTQGASWNYPNIYQMIESMGLTPYDDDVVIVQANNSQPTRTHFNLSPGDHLFIDTRTDGGWTAAPDPTVLTALGNSQFIEPDGISLGALVAQVGESGQPVLLGSSAFNVQVDSAGVLYLRYNDGADGPPGHVPYVNNTGCQIVRVIAAR